MNGGRRKRLSEAYEMVMDARAVVEAALAEEEDGYDNLPEPLRAGERGGAMRAAIGALHSAVFRLANAEESILEAIGESV